MTDEALFARRFIADVRRCAAGRAPSTVAELEARIRAALDAPAGERDGHWARVVGAVTELLAGLDDHSAAATRLRRFLRENADLDRPRDAVLPDFRFFSRPEGVLRTRSGNRFLLFAIPRAAVVGPVSLDEVVPAPARWLAEWAVYGLCGGTALGALWFAFIVPV